VCRFLGGLAACTDFTNTAAGCSLCWREFEFSLSGVLLMLRTSLVLTAAVLLAAPVFAGEGKGKGKGHDKHAEDGGHPGKGPEKRPKGWSKGEKTGWRGEFPPGWEKKSDKDKNKWFEDYEEAVEKVGKEADKRKIEPEKRSKLEEATERMIRKGSEAKKAAEEVIEALKKGVDIDVILRDRGA
jgi:hypothetical protein